MRHLTTPGPVELFANLPPSPLNMYPSYWISLRYSLVTFGTKIPFDKGRTIVGKLLFIAGNTHALILSKRRKEKKEEGKKEDKPIGYVMLEWAHTTMKSSTH